MERNLLDVHRLRGVSPLATRLGLDSLQVLLKGRPFGPPSCVVDTLLLNAQLGLSMEGTEAAVTEELLEDLDTQRIDQFRLVRSTEDLLEMMSEHADDSGSGALAARYCSRAVPGLYDVIHLHGPAGYLPSRNVSGSASFYTFMQIIEFLDGLVVQEVITTQQMINIVVSMRNEVSPQLPMDMQELIFRLTEEYDDRAHRAFLITAIDSGVQVYLAVAPVLAAAVPGMQVVLFQVEEDSRFTKMPDLGMGGFAAPENPTVN